MPWAEYLADIQFIVKDYSMLVDTGIMEQKWNF